MNDIAVCVIYRLGKDIECVFIDKRQKRTASCRVDFILSDNSHLIIRVIDLISSLAIHLI